MNRILSSPDTTGTRAHTKHMAVLAGLILAMVAAIGLSLDVERRLGEVSLAADRAQSQWSSTRAELALSALLGAADAAGTDRAEALRARVAEARVALDALIASPAAEGAATGTRTAQAIEDAATLTTDLDALEGRGDAALVAAAPMIAARAQPLLTEFSDLSRLSALNAARQAENDRSAISRTLYRMAATAVSLVLILSVFSVVLLRLSRRAQDQAEEQRETALRLHKILETSLDAVLVFDGKGRIGAYNAAAETIFGYTADEALGANLAALVVPEDRKPAFERELQIYELTGQSDVLGAGRMELTARRKSGERFPVELSVDRIAVRDESVFVAFVRDITDRRQAERALVDARDKALAGQRAKAEFLAVMSHEMRTPLNGLLGTLSLLRDTALDQRQANYVSNMEASGQLLMHHVNDVLELSKFEAGKVLIANTSFALDPLLSELIEGQRNVAAANQNDLSYAWLSDPVPAMMGDPVRLRQVLLNLLSNAIKFTRNGAISLECEVLTDKGGETLEFRVIDTGIGIADADLERIFGDFETLDGTYGRSNTGTGLGLGISRRLTQAMGGEIGVDSIEGEGSIFWVRLPLQRATAPAASEQDAPHTANSTPLDVLIVEDNQINRVVLRDMLRASGHRVTEALNGEEGVHLAQSRRFDAILMDISMPVMDGVQATRLIRDGQGPSAQVPIFAVTAHALPDEIRAFRDAGMTDTIGKPIERAQMLIKLAQHCVDKADLDKPGTTPPAQAPQTSAETGPIDQARLRELMQDLGAEAAEQLLHRFIRETDTTLDDIGKGAPAPVLDLVPRLHKIAGSAAVLGASALHARLGQLEALGKSGKEEAFHEGLAELAPIWADTRQKMVNVMAEA